MLYKFTEKYSTECSDCEGTGCDLDGHKDMDYRVASCLMCGGSGIILCCEEEIIPDEGRKMDEN